jgi:hypothetical protein
LLEKSFDLAITAVTHSGINLTGFLTGLFLSALTLSTLSLALAFSFCLFFQQTCSIVCLAKVLCKRLVSKMQLCFFSLSKCLELVARRRLVMWQARKCNDGIFFSLSVGNCFADWDSPLKIRDNQKSRRMSSCKT